MEIPDEKISMIAIILSMQNFTDPVAMQSISDAALQRKKELEEMITCKGCGKTKEENGYCEKDGSSYGDCCWSEHIENCDACKEQSEC